MKKNKSKNNKSSKKVLKIVVPIVLVVVVLGVIVVRNIASAGEAMAQAMAVETMTVEKGDVTQTIETSGTVVSGQQKIFFSPVNATVETADLQVGDLVKAGAKLIAFNLDDLEEQNQKAELTVQANSLGYQDTVNKSVEATKKQEEVKNAVAALQQQVDAKKQEVENLASAIAGDAQAQAVALQEANNSINAQIGTLQQQQSEAAVSLEQSKSAYETAQTAQQNAQVNFDAATAGGNASDISSASEALKAANADRKSVV